MNAALTSDKITPPNEPDGRSEVLPGNQKLPHSDAFYRFRLYIADDSPNSAIARANLAAFCHQHFPDRYEIEIVDVFREPARAFDDEVTLTPMVIKFAPLPTCRIVGTLCDTQAVLAMLQINTGVA